MRSRRTIEFRGRWEQLNDADFKLVEFDQFRNEAEANHFVLSPQRREESTHAIGLISKSPGQGTDGSILPRCAAKPRTN